MKLKSLIDTYRLKRSEREAKQRRERAKDDLWGMTPHEAFLAFSDYAKEVADDLITCSVKIQDPVLVSLYKDMAEGMSVAAKNAMHFTKSMSKLHDKTMNQYKKIGPHKVADHHPYIVEAVDYIVKNYGL